MELSVRGTAMLCESRIVGRSASDADVIQAFLAGRASATSSFCSDGRRLHSGDTLIAEWTDEGLVIVSTLADALAERRKDALFHHILWRMQRDQVLRRLVSPGCRN